MPYYSSGSRASKNIAPGVSIKTFWGEHIHLSLVTIEPGGAVPRHAHPNEQAGTVLEGEMTLGVGDEERVVRQGDYYIIPPDTYHWVKTASQRVVALDIFSPVREDYKY
jgi:quercetin dioxygenase-like cupin family protein